MGASTKIACWRWKGAAKLLGIPQEEYAARIAIGEKWCTACKAWHSRWIFRIDRSRSDGLATSCKGGTKAEDPDRPSKPFRQRMRSVGKAWCSKCKEWLLAGDVTKQGVCRPHANEIWRANYPKYQAGYSARKSARKRDLAVIPPATRELIFDIFSGLCAYCGKPATTLDHVLAVAHGGESRRGNLLPACVRCNSSKRTKSLEDFLEICDSNKIHHMIGDELMMEFN